MSVPASSEWLYAQLHAQLHAEGGAEHALDFIANKHMLLLCERAQAHARERARIDYQALTPHDLQTRVVLTLKQEPP